MSLRLIRENPVALRASGSLFALAFLFTLALSDAPRMHERLHKALGPDHECAVTMVLSGNVDYSAVMMPAVIAPPLSTAAVLVVPRVLAAEPVLDFSLLEHAPPTLA